VDGLRSVLIGATHFGVAVDVAALGAIAIGMMVAGAWRFSKIEV
jgi:hypothetical protein